MKFNIRGNKIKITEPIREYVEEKIGRLDKYFDNPDDMTANVVARISGHQQIIEVTIPAKKIILRGENAHEDLYAAIDLVSEKLESQIRKNKTRMHHKNNRVNTLDFNFDYDNGVEEDENKIVRRKEIELKPMSEEEAILQMNLLDHSFFVFEDAKTEKISVLYQRKDGNYGIIETK
ncbi:MAG: ribosome-associated translation inhibitor RaiA [Bacilli bacterium]|nr:ribosome-associated translation inhibitor RaiA [Bacilli bacterium]MDD4808890.1 ribosome-associated translation inhibitor RaiA [Bacilli bacterium]